MDEFEAKRKEYVGGLSNSGHLNNALIGIVPTASLEAMGDLARLQQKSVKEYAGRILALESEFKNRIAGLIGSEGQQDIAFVQNTSTGISIIAHGVLSRAAKAGQQANVVLMADEYPSNREVWVGLSRRYGCQARLLPPNDLAGQAREEIIEAGCDGQTLALAVSAVQYSNGYAYDLPRLGEFCRRKGIFLMVDGIQACGVMPMDVRGSGINALVVGGHKWLMSPEGLGFLYTDEACRERIDPLLYGWRMLSNSTTGQDADDRVREDANRYESGTQPNYLLAALNQSVSIIADLGVEGISRYLWGLRRRLYESVADMDGLSCALPFESRYEAADASPIFALGIEGQDHEELARKLYQEHGLYVMVRGGRLRISPHIYNSDEEMDKLASALRACAGRA